MEFNNEPVVKNFVSNNKNLFVDIESLRDKNCEELDGVTEYTILNYGKILNDMAEYLKGYMQYKSSEDQSFGDKVIKSTTKLYDSIFSDNAYRTTIVLDEFNTISESFLKASKKLNEVLEICSNRVETNSDNELKQVMHVSNMQYNKVSRVFKDDAQIYIWLKTKDSTVEALRYKISGTLLQAYENKSSPTIHLK